MSTYTNDAIRALDLERAKLDELYYAGGGEGTFYHTTGAHTGLKYKSIVVNADVVFSVLTDSAGNDLLTDLGISTNTISKGLIIKAEGDRTIATMTITSGSVVGIKAR